MTFDFDAYVTAALFDRSGRTMFALGDGTVRAVTGDGFVTVEAHQGAVLSACVHPSGLGILTGGDDGRVVWTRLEGGEIVASLVGEVKGRWIDSVAASAESGLIAFTAGRDLHVLDPKDPAFSRVFTHEKSAADVAFDAKGRRLAVATYNGAALWYARIADQKPQILKWAGSHVLVAWSPDGRFLMSAMQENQLHGWKVADDKNLRMGGYPGKVKSMSFLSNGLMMATSGSCGGLAVRRRDRPDGQGCGRDRLRSVSHGRAGRRHAERLDPRRRPRRRPRLGRRPEERQDRASEGRKGRGDQRSGHQPRRLTGGLGR